LRRELEGGREERSRTRFMSKKSDDQIRGQQKMLQQQRTSRKRMMISCLLLKLERALWL
jgi:hypothetical protein